MDPKVLLGLVAAIVIVLVVEMSLPTEATFKLAPGVLVHEEPSQVLLDYTAPKWKKDDFVLSSLAAFHMKGRVVSIERYRFGSKADLSPVDFVLGWGPMSDTSVLEKIKIRQSGRSYSWDSDDADLSTQSVTNNSANLSMIPATDKVREKLLKVMKDDIVDIDGFLIRIDRPEGWSWVSSLARDDTGEGASEVVWVESLGIRRAGPQ